MTDGTRDARAGGAAAGQDLARLQDVLRQLAELEPRLGGASGSVEMSLLEHATELTEEAGRLLERLGRVAG